MTIKKSSEVRFLLETFRFNQMKIEMSVSIIFGKKNQGQILVYFTYKNINRNFRISFLLGKSPSQHQQHYYKTAPSWEVGSYTINQNFLS